jgi:hypothetical protein
MGKFFCKQIVKLIGITQKVSLHIFSTLAKELGAGPIRLEDVPEEKYLPLSAE